MIALIVRLAVGVPIAAVLLGIAWHTAVVVVRDQICARRPGLAELADPEYNPHLDRPHPPAGEG